MRPPTQRGLKFNKTVLEHTNAALVVPIPHAKLSSTQLSSALITPLATDAVQYAAIAAATQGQSLLLYGAAGTGKSQTITNTIAQCFAVGKRVLLVADDPDALEKIYKKLQQLELDGLCLPLYQFSQSAHFSPRLLDCFQQRIQQNTPEQAYRQTQFDELSRQIHQLRQQLDQYRYALHCPQPIGWSVYQALSAQIGQYDQPRFGLPELAVTTLSAEGLAACLNAAYEVSVLIQPVLPVPQHPLAGFASSVQAAWSVEWQQQQVEDLQAWQPLLASIQQQVDQQFYGLGLRLAKNWRELAQQLLLITQLYQMQQQYDSNILQRLQCLKTADDLQQIIQITKAAQQIQVLQQQLNSTYHSGIYLNISLLQDEFQHAVTQFWPWSSLQLLHVRRRLASYSVQAKRLSCDQIWHDLQILAEIKQQLSAFEALTKDAERLFVIDWSDLLTDWTWVQHLSEAWHVLNYLADRLGLDAAGLLQRLELVTPQQQQQLCIDHQALQQLWQCLGDDVVIENRHYNRLDQPLNLIQQRIQRLLAHQQLWRVWYDYQSIRQHALQLGLKPALDALEQGGVLPSQFRKTVLLNIQQDWLIAHVAKTAILAAFDRQQYSGIQAQEQVLIKQQCYVAKQLIQQRQRMTPQARQEHQQRLESLCPLSFDNRSIHVLLQKTRPVWSSLTPCVMATSAMLSTDSSQHILCLDLFDLVIIDVGVQQISTSLAATAQCSNTLMLVADQAINAHSTKQHTATKFNENIQDQMFGVVQFAKLPQYPLRWHYRSRSERLFEFSNQYYYNQQVYSFPTPQRHDRGLRLDLIEHGAPEHLLTLAMDHIVCLIQQILADCSPKQANRVTVVVWNAEQQRLLKSCLQAKLSDQPESLALMTIQLMSQISSQAYDQVILLIAPFSEEFTQVSARQFNLALTRATHHLHIISTVRAQHLRPLAGEAAILQDVKAFLHYAEQQCHSSQQLSRDAPPWDAAFEQYIYHALIMRGWDVHTQLGVSGYHIDLAVVNPENASHYILAILCDGQHGQVNSINVADEHQRLAILQQRGWTIYQVWALDWWRDPHTEIERLQSVLLEQQFSQKSSI